MLGRLKSFVTPSITPSSSQPPSPKPGTAALPQKDGASSPSTSKVAALPLPTPAQLAALKAREIPLSDRDCMGCDGEDGEDGYDGPELPRKFEVDLESEMLGSSKPMHRLALISTSKNDWPRDICDDSSSLAFHLSAVHQRKTLPGLLSGLSLGKDKKPQENGEHKDNEVGRIEGIYETKGENKLTVLASSVLVDEHEAEGTTALVFPDYKFISSIPISKSGAQAFYSQTLDPAVGRLPSLSTSPDEPAINSWALPYKAVIMLCSHKSRDKRCAIAAPLLESVLSQTLSLHGYTVDTTGSSLSPSLLSPISPSAQTSEAEAEDVIKGATRESKEVGIFKISHLGGHRYAGVMIIALPTGAMLYYGRVRPRDCVAIVEETVLGGKILPQHLRSAGNVSRSEGKGLNDW